MSNAYLWIFLLPLFVSPITGQSPDCAGNCLAGSEYAGIPDDDSKLCTITAMQYKECMNKCGNGADDIQPLKDAINSRCSARPGCENFLAQLNSYTEIFGDSLENLALKIKFVIDQFNARIASENECENLRKIAREMKIASSKCDYLSYINNTIVITEEFRKALYACGAENVPYLEKNEDCFMVEEKIGASCTIDCQLTNTLTAGEFCSTLQYQINCIVGHSKQCKKAQEKFLVPRLDTYAIVNQFFKCNISVNGLLVKPLDHTNCDYKIVLQTCYNMDMSKITLGKIQRIVNLDFNMTSLDVNISDFSNLLSACTKSFWSCLLPVAQIYKKPQPDQDFNILLGTFPLNSIGLEYISRNKLYDYERPMICKNPGYNIVKTTPGRLTKTTPVIKKKTTPTQG